MEASLNYCVQVMINESMVHILDIQMAKSLSLVSRFISNTAKPFIGDSFYFHLHILHDRKFTFYQPKNIKNVSSISQINDHIRRVKFNDTFNECVDLSMFTNLTHIEYGYLFNQSIENRLPPNLTNLSFGLNFNQEIDSLLPQKLSYLELGFEFKHTLSNLPLHLKYLHMGGRFNHPLKIFQETLQT
eukprot:TRINITY_DN3335_c0_g3_i9.p1 TRINITY_DN3335_c0_g3~~TRINITY_DN3335_c0_g3_i9.p1  ORF type:complete len:187 (-),score=13.89 TRINITY_DN3335_c0_g3_i9:325-885(-)